MSADHHSPPLPSEPETPTWLTAVGGVLFGLAALWWLSTFSVPSQPVAAPAAASASAAATPPAH